MPAEEGFESPRAGVTGGFEPYSVSAVNQTQVPCQEEPGREPSILDSSGVGQQLGNGGASRCV